MPAIPTIQTCSPLASITGCEAHHAGATGPESSTIGIPARENCPSAPPRYRWARAGSAYPCLFPRLGGSRADRSAGRQRHWERLLVFDAATQRLDVSTPDFGVEAPLFRIPGRLCCDPFFSYDGDTANELLQPQECRGAVSLLGPVLLRLDDQHAFLGNALIGQAQQALLASSGQRGGRDVESQVDGAGVLLDGLSSGALGTHGRQLDFLQWNPDLS